MLSKQIAQSIVDEVGRRLGYQINLMDRQGIIIGSSDEERLQTVHQGALRVLSSGQMETLSSHQAVKMSGTKAGVNAPIRYAGKIVGVVGITGTPRVVAPLAEVVVMVTELLLEQHATFASELSRSEMRQKLIQQLMVSNWGNAESEEVWLANVRHLYPKFEIPIRCFACHFSHLPEHSSSFELYRPELILQAQVDGWLWFLWGANLELDPKALFGELEPLKAISFPVTFTLAELRRLIPLGLSAARMIPAGLIDLERDRYLVLLANIPAQARLAYGSSIRQLGPSLSVTLKVWLESTMNAQAVARELGIHRNTLLYRLERIKNQTGCDPLTIPGATQLQLGLWCVQGGDSDKNN